MGGGTLLPPSLLSPGTWWSMSGSVTMISLGSSCDFWLGLVKMPGVWRPACDLHPIA